MDESNGMYAVFAFLKTHGIFSSMSKCRCQRTWYLFEDPTSPRRGEGVEP